MSHVHISAVDNVPLVKWNKEMCTVVPVCNVNFCIRHLLLRGNHLWCLRRHDDGVSVSKNHGSIDEEYTPVRLQYSSSGTSTRSLVPYKHTVVYTRTRIYRYGIYR